MLLLTYKYKSNIKKYWEIIKEITGTKNIKNDTIPRRTLMALKPMTMDGLTMLFKILERIMYNRLYKFLSENNLLSEKQFGFQPITPLFI